MLGGNRWKGNEILKHEYLIGIPDQTRGHAAEKRTGASSVHSAFLRKYAARVLLPQHRERFAREMIR